MAGSRLIAQGIDRRRAIMRFVKSYWKRNGFAPSLKEVAQGVELASTTAARYHIQILIDAGQLRMVPGKYRSLHVVDQPKRGEARSGAAKAPEQHEPSQP